MNEQQLVSFESLDPNVRVPLYSDSETPDQSAKFLKQTAHDAFYGAALSQDEDPITFYDNIIEQMEAEGDSILLDSIRQSYKQSNDLEKIAYVESLATNTETPVEVKRALLQKIALDDSEKSLRTFYLENLVNNRIVEENLLDNNIEEITFKVHGGKLRADLETVLKETGDIMQGKKPAPVLDENAVQNVHKNLEPGFFKNLAENVWDPIVSEPMSFLQMLVMLPSYVAELATTGYIAATDGKDTNFTEARKEAQKIVAEEMGDWLIENYQQFAGLFGIEKEDIENAWVTKAFTKLDEGLLWMAKKISPNDPDLAKIPLEIATAFAIPIFKKGKNALEKTINPEGYKLKQELQKQIDDAFKEDQKGTSTKDSKLDVPEDSPIVQTANADPKAAKELGEMFMLDETGKAASATKMSVAQFIYTFMVPATVRKAQKGEIYDATPTFKDLIARQQLDSIDFVFNKHLVDQMGRFTWVQDNVHFLNQLDNTSPGLRVDMAPSQSHFLPKADKIEMSLAFNEGGINYTSPTKAIDAATFLQEQINKRVQEFKQDPGEILIQATGVDGNVVLSKNIKDFRQALVNPELSANIPNNFIIKWKRTGNFLDEVKQGSEGFGKMPWLDGNWITRKIFDTEKFWNYFAVFGKFGKEFELRTMMSGLKAERAMKDQMKIFLKEVNELSPQFRKDLKLLWEEQQNNANTVGRVSDLFNLDEIRTTLGYKPTLKHVNQLQKALALARQIDKFNYKAVNRLRIEELETQGFKHYIDIMSDKGGLNRRMVMDEFEFTPNESVPYIWDPDAGAPVKFTFSEGNTGKVKQFLYENGTPTREIVKLAGDFVASNGVKYEYALVPKNVKLHGAPDWIVPSRTGHFPLISQGTYFVTRFPKIVNVNGVTKSGSAKYNETVAMFESRTQYEKMKAEGKLPFDMNDANYVYEVRKANEFNLGDNIDAEIIRQAVNQSALGRNDRIFNPIHADPLESFITTSQRLGHDAYIRPIVDQLKIQWLEKYGKKLSIVKINVDSVVSPREKAILSSGYPLTRTDIRSKGQLNPTEFRQAITEWERINVLENGHGGNSAAFALHKLADVLGDVTDTKYTQMLTKFARTIERNPEMIVAAPLRVVSTLKIILAAIWRNITLQPIGIVGPLLVGPNRGSAMVNTMHTVYGRIINKDTFRQYKPMYQKAMEQMFDNGDIVKGTGVKKDGLLNKQDIQLILNELDTSGYGVVSDHVLAQGVFSSTPKRLTDRKFFGGSLYSQFERYASKGLQAYSKAGFEFGEYINRVGMWHASREVWMSKNPNKNWRTRKALDEITFEAWKLSGSMNKQATYAFQRVPILQYIGQFQAFGMKASENIWNSAASPYSGKQRGALAAYNLAVWGPRAGMIYGLGELLEKSLEAIGQTELAQNLDDYALANIVVRNIGDTLSPTRDENGDIIPSKLDIPVVYSPFGNDLGGVYQSFWKSAVVLSGQEVDNYQMGPTVKTIVDMFEVGRLFKAMYGNPTYTFDEKFERSLVLLAKLTSGGNSIARYLSYNKLNEKVNEYGQRTGVKDSYTDRLGTLFSVPNSKETALFKAWNELKSDKERMTALAEDLWKNNIAIKGNDFKLGEFIQLIEAFNAINDFTYNERELLYDHMIVLDNRRANTRFDSFFKDMIEREIMSGDRRFTEGELMAMQAYVEQAPASHKDLVEQIVVVLKNQKKGK